MKTKITVCIVTIIYGLLVLNCFLKPADAFSASERRKLAQRPELSLEAIGNGQFAADTEAYVTDQFPFRDEFRALKSQFALGIMQKQDNNEIYYKDGYLCAMEYPMDENSIERAGDIFESIYNKNIKGTDANAYLCIIPDKNYFLAKGSHLSMDYEAFYKKVYENTPFLKPIEIRDLLGIEDYYKTDTHLRQEMIMDVAKRLGDEMNPSVKDTVSVQGTESSQYTTEKVDAPFYGVYYGQAALPIEPDIIYYLTNDALDNCKVYNYEINQENNEIPLYDIEKTTGRDPYEMFLGGNSSLITIENPNATSDKELVVFGDSFCRSIVPLLAENYEKITLYDIRYLPSVYIGNYVTFSAQDVLFLYSTSVLNNSITLK